MFRPSALVTSLFIAFAGMGACDDAPSAGTLGSPCNLHDQCKGQLFCDIDDLGRQCTLLCTTDAECETVAKGGTCILGAGRGDAGPIGHCVMPCSTDGDCPKGAVCAVAGWCARDRSTTDVVGRRDVPPDGGTDAAAGGNGGDSTSGGTGGDGGVGGAGGDTDASLGNSGG